MVTTDETTPRTIPPVVRNKALAAGVGRWLRELPGLGTELERDWSITNGRPYADPTEAFVAEATLADGAPAVLKVHIARPSDHAANEITVLRLADGEGCARLHRSDPARGALLLERLGPSLSQLDRPLASGAEHAPAHHHRRSRWPHHGARRLVLG